MKLDQSTHSCCHGEHEHPTLQAAPGSSYTCPMHPEIIRDKPGSCPICGMDLEPMNPANENDHDYRAMRLHFIISCLLTLPIIILSSGSMIPGVSIDGIIPVQASRWTQFALATPVVFWCGWLFFQRAWLSFVHRCLNMFTLISLGVGAAYLYSLVALLFSGIFPAAMLEHGMAPVYFEAAAMITTLVLLGQVLELKARSKTGKAIRALMGRAASTARLVNGSKDCVDLPSSTAESRLKEHEIPIEDVKVGDVLRVRPGDKVPVDGIVVEGSSFIDEAMITGESALVEKKVHDKVTGGTINQNGSFLLRAEKIGSDTLLSRIVSMVSEAQRSRAPIQSVADTVSSYFVPLVMLVSAVTFLVWLWVGPEPRFAYALLNAIAVLIIACPCALGLATPMSIMVGMGRGAQHGILIRNAEALELMESVDTVAVDKTGTLTEGHPKLTSLVTAPGWTEQDLLQLAASVEQGSEHPIAAAVLRAAQERKIPLLKADRFLSVAGGGVTAEVQKRQVIVGKAELLREKGVVVGDAILHEAKKMQEQAKTVVFVAVDGKEAGILAVNDPIKATTAVAIVELHRLGLRVMMLTGDNQQTAHAVAKELGIDEFYAGVSPQDKYAIVQRLKEEKHLVAMAGDGINDSPALAAATVGIAMGDGTDVAMESAPVTLVKGDLMGIANAMKLSRETMRNIRQNLFLAFVYNVLGVPIAAGILYPFTGWLLSPIIASAAMSLSSLSVVGNALRLRGK